jgi:TatD DNase family protein
MTITTAPIALDEIIAEGGLVDIGANLGHESFQRDLPAVLQAASAAAVGHIVVTGTNVEASETALQIARDYPAMLSSTAGIHPHEATHCTIDALAGIRTLAADPQVVALGEMGLDFNRDYSPRPVQESAFEAQLALACELGKPVFLHEREAHSRFYPILKAYRDHLVSGVVHCFTGDRHALYQYLDLDMHIGITGWVCDERRGQHLHDLLRNIPANRLMLETDAPYLLPRTIRPKPANRRNEPANLGWVLMTVAQCRGLSAMEVALDSTRTARQFFGLNKAVIPCKDSDILSGY